MRRGNQITTIDEISGIIAENYPDTPAFRDAEGGEELTWGEFDARTETYGEAFASLVSQGDRVAFFCEGSVDHVTAWYGAARAGAITTNLHTKASPGTVRYCIEHVQPSVLVVDEEFSEFLQNEVYPEVGDTPNEIVTLGAPGSQQEMTTDAFLEAYGGSPLDLNLLEDDIAYIMWSSGTSGEPTGWCHTHRTLMLKLMGGRQRGPRARNLLTLSPSFGPYVLSIIGAMLSNRYTIIMREWDPEEYARLLDEEDITRAGLVATMWREILRLDDLDEYDFSSLESIGTTGETLDTETLDRLQAEICEEVTNGYASSEVVGTSIHSKDMEGDRIHSVGKPSGLTQVRVIEPDGEPDETLPPGEIGEIIIKSPDRAVWAWRDTATTEETFRDGWWYSGDLGYKDDERFLYIEGRKDFMIKSRGAKVYPTTVEECLNVHPDVDDAAVTSVADEEFGQKVVAIVKTEADLAPAELDEWCLDDPDLARRKRPRAYCVVDEDLPSTGSGKLDRSALQPFFEDRVSVEIEL